jgi:hypothetical protein
LREYAKQKRNYLN